MNVMNIIMIYDVERVSQIYHTRMCSVRGVSEQHKAKAPSAEEAEWTQGP